VEDLPISGLTVWIGLPGGLWICGGDPASSKLLSGPGFIKREIWWETRDPAKD
jgi:hypothetical protein